MACFFSSTKNCVVYVLLLNRFEKKKYCVLDNGCIWKKRPIFGRDRRESVTRTYGQPETRK